jgi:mono/diheme cytochrome c family protein
MHVPDTCTEETVMLKPLVLVSAIALFAITPTSALGRPPQDAAAPHAKSSPDAVARAKKIYAVDCSMCHGDNGNGKTDLAKDMQLTLSDWTDPTALAGKPDQELFDAIRKGKGKMPPEDEGRAKDDIVWALIQYIRDMPKQAPAAPAPAGSGR